jgi:hypothetical protein
MHDTSHRPIGQLAVNGARLKLVERGLDREQNIQLAIQTGIGPRIARWRQLETFKGDLRVGATELAQLWFGDTSETSRRGIFYRFERGRLLGAFKYSGIIAARISTTNALMWVEEIKGLDEGQSMLAELNLQLHELDTGLSECSDDFAKLGQLSAVIEATRRKLEEVLRLPSRD